jgi:hypothetical protein
MQTAATPEFRAAVRQGNHLFLVADEVIGLAARQVSNS